MYSFSFEGRKEAKRKENTIDLRDPKVREEFLTSEMMKANQKITEGELEVCFRKFTLICRNKFEFRRKMEGGPNINLQVPFAGVLHSPHRQTRGSSWTLYQFCPLFWRSSGDSDDAAADSAKASI